MSVCQLEEFISIKRDYVEPISKLFRYHALFLSYQSTVEITRQRGAVLERWDGIDGYLTRKLLEDPRFPSMPTYVSYTQTFGEPVNWGDNYGSRITGYFVPKQTGRHSFFIGKKRKRESFTFPRKLHKYAMRVSTVCSRETYYIFKAFLSTQNRPL